MKKNPIFIHSLFRAGSTYLFSVFRQSESEYYTYQEPLHELTVWAAKNTPEVLNVDHGSEKALQLRHPVLKGGYFKELIAVWPSWKNSISEEVVYQNYFAPSGKNFGVELWRVLIDEAKFRPVIQECRTSGRIRAIKQALGGHHIYLWRNPWDQWWSYKIAEYFDLANRLIIHADNAPEPISYMLNSLSLEVYQGRDISGAFAFYRDRPLDSSASYLVFYMLWCLALREGLDHSDVLINIDALNDSIEYRKTLESDLRAFNIHGVDFSSCKAAQGFYSKSSQTFFKELEMRVHGWLIDGGWSYEQIKEIQNLRLQFEPEIWTDPLEKVSQSQLLAQVDRISQVALRYEGGLANQTRIQITAQQVSAALNAELDVVKLDLHNLHQASHNNWTQWQQSKTQEENTLKQLEQAKAELKQAMETAQSCQIQMQSALARADQSEESTQKYLQDIKNLSINLDSLRQDLYKAHQDNNYNYSISELRLEQLNELYRSKSWRITAPLRWAMRKLRMLRQFRIKILIKELVKKLLRKLVPYVVARPMLKSFAISLVYRLGVADRLKRFIQIAPKSSILNVLISEEVVDFRLQLQRGQPVNGVNSNKKTPLEAYLTRGQDR
jgi:hypothetical protein